MLFQWREEQPGSGIVAGSSTMTSSDGNILRVTGPLWEESTGDRWIPLTKASNT